MKLYKIVLLFLTFILFLLTSEVNVFAHQDAEGVYLITETDEPIVVSLGCHCAPAQYITQFGLRNYAFPFDWLFSNNFDGFCDLIENDFASFLDPNLLNVHPVLPFVVINDLYKIEFRHDFPSVGSTQVESILVPNWKDFSIEVNEKYNRRIARFRDLGNYKSKVFFIRMAYNSGISYEGPKVITRGESVILRDILKRKFPQTDFALIIVNYENELNKIDISPWNLEGILNFTIKDYSSGFSQIFKDLGLL